MIEAIGALEMTSIGLGMKAQDAMLKAGDVKVMLARTICSGKYIIVVTGSVAACEAAVEAGVESLPDGLIDHGVIPRIHAGVFKGLGQAVSLHVPTAEGPDLPKALGVIETFSGVSVLEAADAAAKAADVTILKIHLAMALGGKGYMMLSGSVADMHAAIDAGAAVVRAKGLLVSAVTIAGPSHELLQEYI